MKITEKLFNAQTGEEIVTERDQTAAEKALRLAMETKKQEEEAEKASKDVAKAELLNRLGITEDEAKLLLS